MEHILIHSGLMCTVNSEESSVKKPKNFVKDTGLNCVCLCNKCSGMIKFLSKKEYDKSMSILLK